MSALLSLPSEVAADLGLRPFVVRHELSSHPLLTLTALADLAAALPVASIEHNLGGVPVVLPGGNAPHLDMAPDVLVREIERNDSWMVLKHVEQVEPYRHLLDDLLDELDEARPPGGGAMQDRVGFIFVTAPGATTPAHIDPEQNLLLQIRGTKDVTIAEWPDDERSQQELERYYHGGHRNLVELPERSQTYRLEPGAGVHVPLWCPHWVLNGSVPSVSLSITYRTPAGVRLERVHAVNGHLRRIGLHPRPPGSRWWADHAKAGLQIAWEQTIGRTRPRPG